jgi:predicted RNase H-like HicB family nuclease
MKRKYLAVYEHRRDGYSGYVPDLPGCISIGAELEDMQRNMREAFDASISKLVERGDMIPSPTPSSVYFPHPDEGHGSDHWAIEALEIKGADAAIAMGELSAQTKSRRK